MRALWGTAVAVFLLLHVSGCRRLACEEGTVTQGGICVPAAEARCGEGTTLVSGECISPVVTCGRGTHLRDELCQPEIDLMGNASRFTLVRIDEPSYVAQLLAEDLAGYGTGHLLYLVGVVVRPAGRSRRAGRPWRPYVSSLAMRSGLRTPSAVIHSSAAAISAVPSSPPSNWPSWRRAHAAKSAMSVASKAVIACS